MLEDLSMLPPKRLAKRLEKLADDALPCRKVTVFDGNAEHGLTVAVHVDSRGRNDVLDLARGIEDDPAVRASCGWSLLPTPRDAHWRLLLRVDLERPVECLFTVCLDVRDKASDPIGAAVPLLLAANRFVFTFDGQLDPDRPLVWIAAPVVREPLLELLASPACP